MLLDLIDKHGPAKVARACEVHHATVYLWRLNGALPYYKGGLRIKRYERALAKLAGVSVREFRTEARAEYVRAQKKSDNAA